jgi:hypothetical protein
MTSADIQRIDQALGITLPEGYRKGVVPFPVSCLARNHDYELWDDPDALIILNRQLRAGGQRNPPWRCKRGRCVKDGGSYSLCPLSL